MKKHKLLLFLKVLLLYTITTYSQIDRNKLKYYGDLMELPSNNIDSLLKAYTFFEGITNNGIKQNDTISYIYSLDKKSRIEFKQGFYIESEKSIVEALKALNKIKETGYITILKRSLHNRLGILYKNHENFNEADSLYKRALKYTNKLDDSLLIINNLGNVTLYKKEFQKAKKIFTTALELSNRSNDTLIKALILNNIGITKFNIKKEQGINEIKQALNLRIKKNDYRKICESYLSIARYYKQNNNKLKTKEYINKALILAQKLKNTEFQIQALSIDLAIHPDINVRKYQYLTDSAKTAYYKATGKFAAYKYNYYEQTKKTKEAELNTEKEKQRSLMFQFIGLFIAILAIAGYFIHKAINKKKIVENVIETEGRISKTVHDVVANDVYHIITKIQTGLHSKEELLDDLDIVYQKARKIAHETFVINNEINFGELLNDLCNSYKSASVNIITNNLKAMHWESVSIHKKNMLYRVLQELMTNMTKYSKATLVTLNFKEKGKQISIIYKDNGIGTHLIKKNGLINAENRIKSVGGSIIFESAQEKGFKTLITI